MPLMSRARCVVALLTLAAAAACSPRSGRPAAPPFDLVVENGRIIDGTGSPWYAADIGVRDGRIAAIGRLAASSAARRIDAQGKVVAPGFIDMLGQSELTILVNPQLPSKIFQGITTEITGEGGSAAPLNDAIIAADTSATSISASRRTGARSPSTSRGSRNRASGSTWRRSSAPHKSGEWCSATTISSPVRRSWIG